MTLVLFVLVIPYFIFAFRFVAGRQLVPVWARIVLGAILLAIVILLVISRKRLFGKGQQAKTEPSRGPVRLLFTLYALSIPTVLVIMLAQKRWEYIPALIVPILLTFYLWKWLSRVESQSPEGPSTKR
jgi:hypothetical protein